MKVHAYGDGALYVDLEIDDAPDRAAQTHAIGATLRELLPQADVVIGAGSVALVGVGAWDHVENLVTGAMRGAARPARASSVHTIEAVYDGPDLEEVAGLANLSTKEVAELHASREYVVELVGFLPGFAYLASVDPRLAVARRPVPRPRVEAGSLGIAGTYTGIYPLASPGGWRIVGRVLHANLFDPARKSPALFAPGDRVRFVARATSAANRA
jgi:KipI family sensor histidine kinase inhibitor